jgi:hypothetical protein
MKTDDRPTASNTPTGDDVVRGNSRDAQREGVRVQRDLALPVLRPKRRDLLERAAAGLPTEPG